MNGEKSLTEGPVHKVLLRFTLPFLLANLLQALYGAVDLFVIGKYCNPESVAAVSTGTQVTQIITSLITGFTLAGTILVGKYTGMERKDKAEKTIWTTISFFGLFSLALTVVFLLSIPGILSLLQVPEVSRQEAWEYIFICSLGIFFVCEYNALSAVLRGLGDSLSPLVFVSIACVCNIAGDFITVAGLGMGPSGTAAATVFSQGISMAGAILYLSRKQFSFRFSLKKLGIDKKILKEIIQVGIPVSFQECIVRLSFLYLTAITNGLGVNAASAVGIASKYDVFAMLPATSAGNALAALTAQNLGAGKSERARKFLIYAAGAAFGFSLLFFAWAQLAPETMISVFSSDSQVIQAGIPFFRSCSLDYLAVALLFSLNGYLNGCEKTLFTMVCSCSGALLIRIPLLNFIDAQGIRQLGIYGLVSPCSSLIMLGVILFYLVWATQRGTGQQSSVA